jgi:hypothetical protein
MKAFLLAAMPAAPMRAIHFAAFVLALAYLLTPDCCLYGRHAHGFGMAAFGPICRASVNQ